MGRTDEGSTPRRYGPIPPASPSTPPRHGASPGRCGLTERCASALGSALSSSNSLEVLNLSWNSFGARGARLLAAGAWPLAGTRNHVGLDPRFEERRSRCTQTKVLPERWGA